MTVKDSHDSIVSYSLSGDEGEVELKVPQELSFGKGHPLASVV